MVRIWPQPHKKNTYMYVLQGTGINTLNAELNPICHLLALLGAHHILHDSRLRVKYFLYAYISYV